jgi:hypothetical protein
MAVLAMLVALALGAAACGDDGDDGDDGGGGAAAASQDQPQPEAFDNTPEGRIRALHAQYIDLYYDKNVAAVCDLTSRKGRRLWAKNAKSCEDGMKKFLGRIVRLSKNRPRVLKVRISGDRAIAQTRVKGSSVYPVLFRKEGGEWKLDGGGA